MLLEVCDLKKHYVLAEEGPTDLPGIAWYRSTFLDVKIHLPVLHAVDGVSFSMQSGDSLGLVGESGCGKSTLVSMLARLSEASEGAIRFEGKDISSIPAIKFHQEPERADIQIVFQDPHESLNPRFTAYDTIAEPLKRLLKLQGKNELREKVETIADQVDFPRQLLGRFPHQLSGGQKARVNIARAIAVEPKLLILDEPTSALDVSVQAVILKLLVQLKQELGMSYLFVSHDLNVVRLLCDHVIVMYLGQIVEAGPAEAIFAEPAHPYTQALVAAIPGKKGKGSRHIRLEGDPKSPIDPDPSACRLHGRCPKGQDICRRAAPPKVSVGADHSASCHFI